MEHSDIEHMAQGLPPSHIGKDHEEVATELAKHALELQQKLDAVVAENAALLIQISRIIDIVSKADNSYCMCGESMESHVIGGCGSPTGMLDYHFGKLTEEKAQTPATDALLNAVRAEGIEILTSRLQQLIDEGVFDAKEIGVAAGAVYEGAQIASQLRAETDTTPSQYESLAGGK
ncbi:MULTISPECIES: hypothetical protein [Pantoea]|uniref:hypothetical protein n=1 Tax=Pantoea TaxID=53335 RepID=UPI0025927759|nr:MULTISPECIES: hypothetical protein [Pantoea]